MIKLKEAFKYGIRWFIWTKIVPIEAMCAIREKLGPNKTGRIFRKILFPLQMVPGYDLFNFYMDDEKFKFLRSTYGTHRATSNAFKEEYPGTDVVGGDQMDGKWLRDYERAYYCYKMNKGE